MKKRYFFNLMVSAVLFTTSPLFAMEADVPQLRITVRVDPATVADFDQNGVIQVTCSSVVAENSAMLSQNFGGTSIPRTFYGEFNPVSPFGTKHAFRNPFGDTHQVINICSRTGKTGRYTINTPLSQRLEALGRRERNYHTLEVGKNYTIFVSNYVTGADGQPGNIEVAVSEDLDNV